jgi:hypothetical protein
VKRWNLYNNKYWSNFKALPDLETRLESQFSKPHKNQWTQQCLLAIRANLATQKRQQNLFLKTSNSWTMMTTILEMYSTSDNIKIWTENKTKFSIKYRILPFHP